MTQKLSIVKFMQLGAAWHNLFMSEYPKAVVPPFPIEFVQIPQSNFQVGRNGMTPDAIAIHIADGGKSSVISTFTDPFAQKSSHFLVCRDGSIVQFVSTANASFCTGNVDNPINELVLARWPQSNPNDWTISIEHEGFGISDISGLQYPATAILCKFLSQKWGVPLDRTHIFGHKEAYSKKACPGLVNVEKIIQKARLL